MPAKLSKNWLNLMLQNGSKICFSNSSLGALLPMQLHAHTRSRMPSDHSGPKVSNKIDMGIYILYLTFCLGVRFSPILLRVAF